MASIRPEILASLKSVLVTGVVSVEGRVYLPWDDVPENAKQSEVRVAVEDTNIQQGIALGMWHHTILIKIGVVRHGQFDYAAVWDALDEATAAINAAYQLNHPNVINTTITGGSDHITVASDKILWPHIDVTIEYRTPEGHL